MRINTLEALNDEVIKDFALKEMKSDMGDYYVTEIVDNIIHVYLEKKSNKKTTSLIGDQPVSMYHIVVHMFEIPVEKYIHVLRRKKLNKLINKIPFNYF